MSVIIFHMNCNWLPGGYVGVDIFFVISGYLITSIIYHEINENEFSFPKFYARRIKRILPVFYVVTFVSLIFGFFVMNPNDLYGLGNSALSALTFVSNLYFGRVEDGYFNNSQQLPLLHTWSLSIEEQFYILWPAILLLFFKIGYKYKKIIIITIVLMLFSFGASEILLASHKFANWSYYLLPTRAGELMVGSLLAFFYSNGGHENNDFKGHLASLLGFVLIGLSLIFLNKNSAFPGINSLWPSLGAGLIIFGNPNSIINKFLSYKPMVYIGLISYSLYLWHWPILAFIRYCSLSESNFIPLDLICLAFILIFAASVFSYHFIEKPTRSIKLKFPQYIKYYLVIPSSLIVLVFLLTCLTKGVPSRFKHANNVETYKLFNLTDEKSCHSKLRAKCAVNESQNPEQTPVLIYGDSHAAALEPFFREISKKNTKFVFYSLSASNVRLAQNIDEMQDAKSIYSKNKIEAILNQNIDNYKTIILVGRWDNSLYDTQNNKGVYTHNYIEKLTKSINALTKKGKKIILVSQVPEYDINVNKNEFISKLYGFDKIYNIAPNYRKSNNQIKDIAKNNHNVYFLDFDEFLCPQGICSPYDENGIIMYNDDDHLNIHGSEILAERFIHSDRYNWFYYILSR
jgi:peptidoglycan/LPS O-acetylase OafA/YrhL